MSTIQLSHDPYARESVVRESVRGGNCNWCGSTKKTMFKYGIVFDDRPGRVEFSNGVYCGKSCWEICSGRS